MEVRGKPCGDGMLEARRLSQETTKTKTLKLENAWNVTETVGNLRGWGHMSETQEWRGGAGQILKAWREGFGLLCVI